MNDMCIDICSYRGLLFTLMFILLSFLFIYVVIVIKARKKVKE